MMPETITSVSPKSVALIDDESIAGEMYCHSITNACGAAVDCFRSPGAFVAALRAGQTFDLIITDVMMPIDEAFRDMVGGGGGSGVYAGLLVVNLLRGAGIQTPIIVLTNLWGSHMEPLLRAQREFPSIELLAKHETNPTSLAEIVRKRLFEAQEPSGLKPAWKRLYKALQLKLTFAGMGIDFKELFSTKSK